MYSVIQTLSTDRANLYTLDSIIPEHLKGNSRFIDFIEAYLQWQQTTVYSPSTIINTLSITKDVDLVADEFLHYIQREIAGPIPNVQDIDKRKLYKNITDIYLSKGSLPSFESLFNVLYADPIELYFPRVDMLKPSDGKWDNTTHRYLDNNGFCSDRKKIQDSYFYQDYSYVIKTSKTFEVWKDIVYKLLHPAGFIFFGQINVISFALKQSLKMPMVQPGRAAAGSAWVPIIINSVAMRTSVAYDYRTMLGSTIGGPYISRARRPLGPTHAHFDQYKFIISDYNDLYSELIVGDVVEGLKSSRVPGALPANLDSGYRTSTILFANFTYIQPSDLASNAYNDLMDLEEPDDIIIEFDLQ